MGEAIAATDVTWETFDGETYGYFDRGQDDGLIEITITGRIRPSMWTTGTNERDWRVNDEHNETIAQGCAEGLRNAKRAALEALSAYLGGSARRADAPETAVRPCRV